MDQVKMLWRNIKLGYLCFKKKIQIPDSYSELIKLLLPEIVVNYFKLTSYKKADEILYFHFKEIYSIPKEYRQNKLSSKRFFEEITVQDFPIRGHQIYLHITRRRWLNEDTG